MYQPPNQQPPWQPQPQHLQQPFQQPQQGYPPSVPPYFQPPPMMPPPPRPVKRLKAWQIVLLIIGILVVIGILGNIINQQSNSNTATSPGSTPQATDTPTPMPTALTNPDDIKSELQSDANSALTGSNITADYGAQLSKAVIFETSLTKQPLSFIQSECFNMQKAVWQDQQLRVKIVDFAIAIINGQLLNVYGECVLDTSHASKINWDNTDAVTAWNNKVYQDMKPHS